ncbi:hypothetical protein ACJX0J_005304, partial [Zea mays]
IVGIVIHLAPLEHISGRPYREAILMDSRWDIIVVGIWPDLLQRNALRWVLARDNKSIIIGTMMRHNKLHRCLQTSDHSTVHFDPDHHTTHRLQIIRRSLIQNPKTYLINRYLERRQAYLATAIPGPVKNTSSAGNSIERKRQRDRERRATMSVQQRNEFNKKRREERQRKKGQNVMPNVSG